MTEPRQRPRVVAALSPREQFDVSMARQLLTQADYQHRLNRMALDRVWEGLRQRHGFGADALYDQASGTLYVWEDVIAEESQSETDTAESRDFRGGADGAEVFEEHAPPLPPPALRTVKPLVHANGVAVAEDVREAEPVIEPALNRQQRRRRRGK